MNSLKILVVEDEPKVAMFIKQGLEEHGSETDVAYDGTTGFKLAKSKQYDIIILDIIIPHMNGIELCKKIREFNRDVKILFLTALGTLDDKLEGFSSGADDYLLKPFDFPELLARINCLTKRGTTPINENSEKTNSIKVADLE